MNRADANDFIRSKHFFFKNRGLGQRLRPCKQWIVEMQLDKFEKQGRSCNVQ